MTDPGAECRDARVWVRGRSAALRLPEPADAPALFGLARDPDVTRYLSWGPYREESEARRWLATLADRRRRGEALELAVVAASGALAGITVLSELSQRDRRCVMGTWLGRRYWGTGLNLEVKAMVARLAFERLALERLAAYADIRHARSQRALERLGFRREGVLRAFHRHAGCPRDVVVFSLLGDEWGASALAEVPVRIEGALPAAWGGGEGE